VTTYILRRILMALVVLIIVTIIVFFVMRLLPGDPLIIFMGQSAAQQAITQEQIDLLRHQYGLDKNLAAQYFSWIGGIARGDFGTSIFYHEKVSTLLAERLPKTIYIGFLSLIFGALLGVAIGLWAGVKHGKWPDKVITPLTYVGIAIPTFWLGILMIYTLGLKWHLLPTSGYTSPFNDFWLSTRQLVMPVICLSLFSIAANARQMRSSILETIGQDYIRTAWSKGLSQRIIILKHALKNSLIPVITLVGMGVGGILGGSVLVETVFSIPGVGRLMVSSIFGQDYVVVQGITLVLSVSILLMNLLVDLSYGWFDPRIRYG
jgi:peptide/nickel transport system permease protein